MTRSLQPSHLREWRNSGVIDSITLLNVQSLDGTMGEDSPIEKLCQNVSRNKTPAFSGFPKSVLDKYRHVHAGGWWCQGVDVLGNSSNWGCFKPDTPRRSKDDRQKLIKYEHPPNTPTEVFTLAVPLEVWQLIADRYGVAPYCVLPSTSRSLHTPDINTLELQRDVISLQFWLWVCNANLPITLTEGAKKAAALLTAGLIGIGLPGIYGGYRQPRDDEGNVIGLPRLIPQLQIFATPEREINFCFDNDSKPKTQENVRIAVEKTGSLFTFGGSQVNVIEWTEPEKGVDDLIVAHGSERFEAIYNNRLALDQYKQRNFFKRNFDISPLVSLNINERYIPDIEIPKNTRLIGLKALHGTGKTEWISRNVQKDLNSGQKVLAITHREQLSRELANRIGIDYRDEVLESETRGYLGYSLCIDSLHPNANPRFNPEHWEDSIIILDEIEQVLWHLLNGGTCEKNRTRILKTLRELLITVVTSEKGKIIISDADLTRASVDYIEQLIGFKLSKYIINNTYVPNNSRQLYLFRRNKPDKLIEKLLENLNKGETAIIHTDGQKSRSTWGTTALEAMLKKEYPNKNILRIDRKSVKDRLHPAYKAVDNLNEILPKYDIVICSPVIETGVSINVNHFDGVYAISHGVQPVNGFIQSIQRVRDDIPRYIWSVEKSRERIGNGSQDIKSLLAGQHKLSTLKLSLFKQDESSFYEEDFGPSPSLLLWAKYACLLNSQAVDRLPPTVHSLSRLGYKIVEHFDPPNKEKNIEKKMLMVKEELYTEECNQISNKEIIDDKTFLSLKEQQKRGLTNGSEDQVIKKNLLSRLYLTEGITPDIIKRHDKKWFYKLLLHYYLVQGQDYLIERDLSSIKSLKENDSKVFKPDFNKRTIIDKVKLLEVLGIERFFDSEAEFTCETEREWFDKLNNPKDRYALKTILNFGIGDKDTPIGVIQRLLGLLGLKLTFDRQQTIDGKRIRVYKGCDIDIDHRQEIFDRWLKRDSQNTSHLEVVYG